jgi:hypothetical protein
MSSIVLGVAWQGNESMLACPSGSKAWKAISAIANQKLRRIIQLLSSEMSRVEYSSSRGASGLGPESTVNLRKLLSCLTESSRSSPVSLRGANWSGTRPKNLYKFVIHCMWSSSLPSEPQIALRYME